MKHINKFKRLSLGLTSVALSAIICASCGALSALAETRNGGLEEPVGGNYFLSDYQNRSELSKAAYSVRSQIYDEGLVMLKNEDNALPLGKGAKISVFGKNNGRAGFSSSAFVNEGFEINPELVKFYGDSSRSGSGAASLPHANITLPGLATGETPIASYDSAVESSYENYSDAAIVYFSRSVGEGRDSPRTMLWNGSSYGAWKDDCTEVVPGARSGDDHYLQLDQNEADLLKYVGDRFDKVVVVLACGSQMETGFLDDPNHYAYHENIKAAFWGGNSTSLARILSGKVNPSGKTTDTWYRDFKLDPTWQSAGNNGVLDGNEYSNLASSSDYLNRYVIYQEGIYVGYRYYETRGYLEGDKPYTSPASGDTAFHGTTTTEWDNWYDAHVVTPFGFGLSYTTFDWEVVEKIPAENSALTQDSTVSISVKVTNTGSVAGKEVVQLYYTAPYTEGGIEKAHVVLGAFDKTDLLEPGESQTLTLNLRARDMASYDWNDANGNDYIGYELDAGNYTLRVMRNSHEEVAAIPYVINENIQYSTSEATGATIKNRFDKVSNYLINDVKKQYMSRADFVGTFPTKQIKISAPQWVIDGLKEWEVANQVSTRSPDADKDMPYYTEVMPTTGAQNGIVLSDLYRKDYDDPLWDSFLDQLTYEQLVQLATRGSYFSGINIPELGITKAINTDGIGGLSAYAQHKELIGEVSNTSWGAQVTLAATWNVDLAYAKGRIIGNEGLWGGSVEYTQIPGYYAPGVNLHRTPFGGRNSQYFSEDGFFTGVMAAEIVKGANDKGMFTYVKHFGVNEQETNRIGVLTWANEQSMREIYFKGFELCVTEGKATGIMSALNRIGYEWTGGSYALLTELLREEWGFNGCVVTDSYMGDNSNLSNADQMIRAGGNLALGNATLKYNPNTPTTVAVLREMAHGLLYMHANSMVLNSAERPIIPAKIKAYIGDILPTGSYMFPFEASVATAEINSERYPEYTAEDVTYALAEDSNPLPEGLTLNSNGTITGTPTEMVENYKITVNATCVDYTSSATFTLNITSGEAEIVYSAASSVLQSAYVGKEYVISVASAQIFAPGLSEEEIAELPTITYGLKNGSALPAGLRLTSGGKIIGVPVEQCKNYSFSVVAFADGISSKTITFTMSVLNDIEIDSKELKLGRFGQNYLDKLDYECDTKVSFQLKEGSTLPNGLALTEGGYVVGKPTQTVTEHKFTVVATSEFTEAVEVEYSISVGVKFDETTKVPNGEVGKAYSTRIDTAQGAGSLTYSIKEGSTLPEGLTLKEDGSITGTPTKAGVYEVTFVATADGKIGDEIILTIYVAGGGSCVASGVEVGSMAIAVAGVGAIFALKKRKESK